MVSGDQVKTRKPKHKCTEIIGSYLPVQEEVFRRLSDKCDHGHQLDTVGKHFVGEEVRMIPSRLYVTKMYQETYKCVECEKTDGVSHIYQAALRY
jgi:isoleucyl-tRNA synthetase